MNNITRIGIDLAKNVFQLCLTDKRGLCHQEHQTQTC